MWSETLKLPMEVGLGFGLKAVVLNMNSATNPPYNAHVSLILSL